MRGHSQGTLARVRRDRGSQGGVGSLSFGIVANTLYACAIPRAVPTPLPAGSSAVGSPGAGGSLGLADPISGIGYAYVTSRMGTALAGDPREVALRNALYVAVSPSSRALSVAA